MMLNQSGAEELLGNGDMMFLPNGMRPMRVQGAFVSENEVHAIVEYIRQSGEAEYDPDMLEHMENATRIDAEKDDFEPEYDNKLPEAVDIAIDLGQVSISMLQRKMRLGYARVGRLIDEMTRRGIVSEADGSKPRDVLITREQARKMFEDDWDGGAGASTTSPVIPKETLIPSPKPTKVAPSYPPQRQSVGRRPMILPYAPRKAVKKEQQEIKYPLHPQSRLSGEDYEIWVADNEIFIHRILQEATGGRIGQTDIHFTAGKIEALLIKLPLLFSKKAFIQFVFEKGIDVINRSDIKIEWLKDAMLTIPYPPESKKEFQAFMQQLADDLGIELEEM